MTLATTLLGLALLPAASAAGETVRLTGRGGRRTGRPPFRDGDFVSALSARPASSGEQGPAPLRRPLSARVIFVRIVDTLIRRCKAPVRRSGPAAERGTHSEIRARL